MNNKEIQVLHISTGHSGGSGLAARRLNAALNDSGIKSHFLALSNKFYEPTEHEGEINRNVLQRIISAVNARFQAKLSKNFFFSAYSLDVLSIKKLKKFARSDSTILHFHNWFNLVDQKKISELLKLGFPVVITLHDERFYTGGCHHAFDCNGFKDTCANCPQINNILKNIPVLNLNKSIHRFQLYKNTLQIIAPSMWIYNRAQDSHVFRNHEIQFIPNTLGNFGMNKLKKERRLPNLLNPKIIGIASVDLNSHLKGADIILNLQKIFIQDSLDYSIVFLSDMKFKEKSQLDFWETIDVLLVPSRADNSPNIIHEAKRFGIPIIATEVGGITELLDPSFDELIPIEFLSASAILSILKNWNKKNRALALKAMQIRFDSYTKNSINYHIAIYQKLTFGN